MLVLHWLAHCRLGRLKARHRSRLRLFCGNELGQAERQEPPGLCFRSPQPAARSPQPAARSPQPAARSPQPAARSPQPAARKPKLARDLGRWPSRLERYEVGSVDRRAQGSESSQQRLWRCSEGSKAKSLVEGCCVRGDRVDHNCADCLLALRPGTSSPGHRPFEKRRQCARLIWNLAGIWDIRKN
jgi:hypothetical protein